MALIIKAYNEVRNKMKPGDIIAFGGKGLVSEAIKHSTGSVVSHVGVILQTKLLIGKRVQDGYFNQVIESGDINDFLGVSITRLSDRLEQYDGQVWWMPLHNEVRKVLNIKAFYDFLIHQVRKPYDVPQAILAGLDTFDGKNSGLTYNKEDFSKFFCSELVVAGLEAGGVFRNINASEVTPGELSKMKIYKRDYYQLKGAKLAINEHNSKG
jgi:hypothetical protein